MTTPFSISLKRTLFLVWFLIIGIIADPNLLQSQSLNQSIDSLIQRVITDSLGPGGNFLVVQRDAIIYQKSVGLANMEWQVELNNKSVFQIGSMTKQFTAIAILILEARGRLHTDDPLSLYLPDFPNASNIKLHHLLTHTSGIADYTQMKALNEIAQKDLSPIQLIDFFKNEAAVFSPGEKFEYNNSGYILLGYIIERVSGLRYEDFIQQSIFDKAGMTSSYYCSDKNIIPYRAHGYHKKDQGYVNKRSISYTLPFSAGSLMSTTADLWKWQKALNNHLLLPPEIQSKAFRPHTLTSGTPLSYGYGWHIKNVNGREVREHGGSIFGYKSMAVYYPAEDVYVVGLTNCDCWSPTQLVRDIAALTINAVK